jgi:hypothetical protein
MQAGGPRLQPGGVSGLFGASYQSAPEATTDKAGQRSFMPKRVDTFCIVEINPRLMKINGRPMARCYVCPSGNRTHRAA